jgi:hypothetical protein
LGQRGLGYVGRKWNERTAMMLEQHGEHAPPGKFKKALFAVLNPKAFAKGWQARSEELEHIASSAAQARGREVAEQLSTWGKLEIPYAQFTERADENNMLKEYENMKKESLMAAALKAEGLGGMEGELRRRAIVKASAKNGYLDDLLRMKHFAAKYASGKKNADGTITANIYDAESLNRFLFGYLGEGEQTYRMLAEDFEDLGKEKKPKDRMKQYCKTEKIV